MCQKSRRAASSCTLAVDEEAMGGLDVGLLDEPAQRLVRHMVGGRARGDKQELLYRFEFPERAGALMKFLSGLGSRWNITLFHYRNHGAAWGRVLVGFEATDADREALASYLDRIGYRYWEETTNPAYGLFLQ